MPHQKLRLSIYHAVHFEEWEPSTPDNRGIGNSETCQIELAKRLAKRGWDVVSYAPVPWRGFKEIDGVRWGHLSDVDWSRSGHWLLFRRPEDLDNFPDPHTGQKLFVVAQDESFGPRWNDERANKVDGVFGLCAAHCRSLEADHPQLQGKVMQSSNGIKLDLIKRIDAEEKTSRHPHRIMWASSPDRGLLNLLKIFRRVRQWVSDAELVVAYGFDNIRKLEALGPQFDHFRKMREEIEREAENNPGVIWLGRVPQPEVLQWWRQSALIVYPTTFRETSCATLMEAQAMGAIPIVSPIWALRENAIAGSMVIGYPDDPLTRARFTKEIFRWMSDVNLQESVRPALMREARRRFDWERQCDLYEAYMLGYAQGRLVGYQFAFQVKHCIGAHSILNLGCADDPANLKAMGAINLDARPADPIFGKKTAADIFCDMRDLSPIYGKQFERLVYGDCLEHFPPKEVPAILREGLKVLAPGGKIIITVPNDYRSVAEQHAGSDGHEEYLEGVSAVHTHPVPREMVEGWLLDAGLKPEFIQTIKCDAYDATGVVASRDPFAHLGGQMEEAVEVVK